MASAFFAQAEPDGQASLRKLKSFIDQHRNVFGVEPICRVLQIAPSGYRRYAARQRSPELRSRREQRDTALMPEIQRVWDINLQACGADNA